MQTIRVTLRDGTPAVIESLRPEHKEQLAAEYQHLSERSRYQRFLCGVPRLTPAMLHYLVDEVDGVRHQALALQFELPDDQLEPAGIARLVVYPDDPTKADVAVTVLDRCQGRGVASALLQALVAGKPPAVDRLLTVVTPDNKASIAMLRRLGPTTVSPVENCCVTVEVRVGGPENYNN